MVTDKTLRRRERAVFDRWNELSEQVADAEQRFDDAQRELNEATVELRGVREALSDFEEKNRKV